MRPLAADCHNGAPPCFRGDSSSCQSRCFSTAPNMSNRWLPPAGSFSSFSRREIHRFFTAAPRAVGKGREGASIRGLFALLGFVPESVHFSEGGLARRLPALRQLALDVLEAGFESPQRPAQGFLRVRFHPPAEVRHREQQIPQLLLDPLR